MLDSVQQRQITISKEDLRMRYPLPQLKIPQLLQCPSIVGLLLPNEEHLCYMNGCVHTRHTNDIEKRHVKPIRAVRAVHQDDIVVVAVDGNCLIVSEKEMRQVTTCIALIVDLERTLLQLLKEALDPG